MKISKTFDIGLKFDFVGFFLVLLPFSTYVWKYDVTIIFDYT